MTRRVHKKKYIGGSGKDIEDIRKLFEELLASSENTLPTHHQQILVGKVREYEFAEVTQFINELILLFNTQDNTRIVSKMKDIVPGFVSNNSVFQTLDKN